MGRERDVRSAMTAAVAQNRARTYADGARVLLRASVDAVCAVDVAAECWLDAALYAGAFKAELARRGVELVEVL